MMQTVVGGPSAPFTWLDVREPTRDELAELAATYGLHHTSVEDSLQPEHLPKVEVIGDDQFAVLRAYDESAPPHALTAQALTRKVALFVSDKVILTIHRSDQPFLAKVREQWAGRPVKATSLPHIVNDLVRGVIDTYERPIAKMQDDLAKMEAKVFDQSPGGDVLQEGYVLRRRASVFRHLLQLTSDIIPEFVRLPKASRPFFQDLKEKCDRLAFYTDDVRDNIDHVLNLKISLTAQATNKASHRVNEVMRLLTVFSAFFLPLNFIASIYGMNFEHMPELKSPDGYHVTLGVMAAVATGIFLWFKKRGWLRAED